MNPLHDAYVKGDEKALQFFEHPPASLSPATLSTLVWPEGMENELTNYQKTLGVEKERVPAGSRVVVTGQQAGLLLGPLYTIYKSITSIQLAADLSRTDAPVIPVFWTASDDHDFDEINHTTLLTRRQELLTLRYTPSKAEGYIAGMPSGEIPLTPQLKELLQLAVENTFSSEQTKDVQFFLEESLSQADSFANWFSRIQARLFSDTPLRVFDPRLPTARRLAARIIEQEIEVPLRSTSLLIETGKQLASLGFGIPIQRVPHACNFFLEVEKRRLPVFYEGGRFHLPDAKLSFSEADLKALLKNEPLRFSGNVALRPVIQQFLFPTVAYVAGPGEVAYWAQLKPLFEFFDQPMPVVYPRMRGRLSTLKAGMLCERLTVDPSQPFQLDSLVAEILEKEGGNNDHTHFEENKLSLQAAIDALVAPALEEGSPMHVQRLARRFKDKQLHALERYGKGLLYSDREKRAIVEKQLKGLQDLYFPLGREQERVLSPFSFLFEHGWSLTERMLQHFAPHTSQIQDFEL